METAVIPANEGGREIVTFLVKPISLLSLFLFYLVGPPNYFQGDLVQIVNKGVLV